MTARIEEYHRLADESADPKQKAMYTRRAQGLERDRRYQQIYPLSVWLWSSSVVCVMLPWGLLAHAHHVVAGLIGSGVVFVALILLRYRLRARRRWLDSVLSTSKARWPGDPSD
jgi:hypothetical protein